MKKEEPVRVVASQLQNYSAPINSEPLTPSFWRVFLRPILTVFVFVTHSFSSLYLSFPLFAIVLFIVYALTQLWSPNTKHRSTSSVYLC